MTADAKEKALDAARTRGQQLDEAVENVGASIEEKVAPVAEKLTEKFEDVAGGPPGDTKRSLGKKSSRQVPARPLPR